jgi:hypothetical protein
MLQLAIPMRGEAIVLTTGTPLVVWVPALTGKMICRPILARCSLAMTADGASMSSPRYPVTPDGRYFVVRGRLWRRSNPQLAEEERQRLVRELMKSRRAVKDARRGSGDLSEARAHVHAAKVALGERGPVWWADGAPDHNRRLVSSTPYASWFQALGATCDDTALT